MSSITLQQQIDCVTREIKMREFVYPGRIRAGKMKPEKADYEIAAMRAVLATLSDEVVGATPPFAPNRSLV